MKKIIVGIGGASAIELALKFVNEVAKDAECHVILSESAKIVWQKEKGKDLLQEVQQHTDKIYDEKEIWAGISSGSFGAEMMAVIPSSMNLLAKIAHGMSDELISRAASVMIKEKRPLLLAPREMPFSSIALENMLKLSNLGVMIAPPVAGYYAKIQTLEQMEDFFVGKWLDVLRIPHSLYPRWGEKSEELQ